jgi:hypothetical protein
LSRSLAIVFRVTIGIFMAAASLAPEPTLMGSAGPPAERGDVAEPRLGTPVKLPGWTLEMPPEPKTKKDVLTGLPLTLLAVAGPTLPPNEKGMT